jgi:hypothetical protein
MLQIQGVKGKAVLGYCELLTTQEVRHLTAFPKGKKQGDFLLLQDSTLSEFLNDFNFYLSSVWLLVNIDLCPVFYATFGFIVPPLSIGLKFFYPHFFKKG